MVQDSQTSKELVVLNKNPKILFYIPRYWPAIAGAALHTRDLVTRLSKDFTIGVIRHSGDEPVVKEIAFARNPTIALTDGVTPIYQLGASPQLRWLIKPLANQYSRRRWVRPLFNVLLQVSVKSNIHKIAQYYDVIHAVYTGMTASIRMAQKVAKRQGKPFILTPLVHIQDPEKKAARSLRQIFLDSDLLIAMTSLEKEWLIRQGVHPEKIHICPYAPTISTHVSPEKFRQRHNLGTDPVILFIARQIPEKGYHPLTLSAQHVWKKYPQARFIFIGPTTSDSRAFFKEVQDPRILNLGEVSDRDKCSALAACDIFCLPSHEESLGVGYLEAWEFEKPVIAADIPVMSKIISDREDGLILPPVPTAIASGIQQLLDNPSWRHDLGCRGYRKVRAHYDWQQLMIKMSRIYSTLPN